MSEDLYASWIPIVVGFTGIVMMILGPTVMVWRLKKGLFENINWLMYGMILFIVGLGLMIYFLAG